MGWLVVGKHTFTFGATAFDIGSDIANSLTFLGVYHNDTDANITSLPISNLTHHTTMHSTMALGATSENIQCAAMDQRRDFIWGVLSLVIVFLPGAVWGISSMLKRVYKAKSKLSWFLFWLILGLPTYSIGFPILLLLIPLLLICYEVATKGRDEKEQILELTQLTAMEATIESTMQLLLQLFTLLNGYQSTYLQ